MQIDKIAFDVGNVLVNLNFDPFFKVYRELGLDREDDPMDFLNGLHGQQDVGLTTISRAAKERFALPKRQAWQLEEAWLEIIQPNFEMLSLVQDMHGMGFEIALLSNMGWEHADMIRRKFPSVFDRCLLHLSCEVGARKPSKLFYQSFLWDYPRFAGCPYIDDLDKNLKVGKSYGFIPIRFALDDSSFTLEKLKMDLFKITGKDDIFPN